MTRQGAEELAAKIKFYWAQRGYSPVIRIEPEGVISFVVRSGMQNGLPPGSVGDVS
jgi:hypothetical protein